MADKILDYPLSLLRLTAQHPHTQQRTFLIVTALYFIAYGILFPLTLMQLFHAKGNITAFVENIEAFGFLLQTMGKLSNSAIKRRQLEILIKKSGNFLKTDVCPVDAKILLDDILANTLRAQKFFFYSIVSCLILVEIMPIFTKQFPLGMWTMDGYYWAYWLELSVQEILIPFLCLQAVAFDGSFIAFSVNLIVQFKILHKLLNDLNVSKISTTTDEKLYVNKLTKCINYHNYLLMFTKELKDAYSLTMLTEYGATMLVFCADMFILSESKNIDQLIGHFMKLFAVLFGLAFYCLPADYISEEATKVGYAIYESNWYSKPISSSRKIIPFLIQRSQKTVIFSAGGLYNMTSKTLHTVLKLGWSASMVVRAIKR